MKKKPVNENLEEAKFISVLQIARRWNLSTSAVYMHRGGTEQLTRYRFGRTIRFELAEIEKAEDRILGLHRGGKKYGN